MIIAINCFVLRENLLLCCCAEKIALMLKASCFFMSFYAFEGKLRNNHFMVVKQPGSILKKRRKRQKQSSKKVVCAKTFHDQKQAEVAKYFHSNNFFHPQIFVVSKSFNLYSLRIAWEILTAFAKQ